MFNVSVGCSVGCWFVCQPVGFDLAGNNLLSTESILLCLTLDCAKSIDLSISRIFSVHCVQYPISSKTTLANFALPRFFCYYYYCYNNFCFLRLNHNILNQRYHHESFAFRTYGRFKHTLLSFHKSFGILVAFSTWVFPMKCYEMKDACDKSQQNTWLSTVYRILTRTVCFSVDGTLFFCHSLNILNVFRCSVY